MASGKTTIAATTTVVAAKNPSRSLLALSNASNENITIDFDAPAVLNEGIVLKPLGPPFVIDSDGPYSAFLGSAVNAICASGGKALAHHER